MQIVIRRGVHTADICVMCPLYCRNGVDTRNKPERFETCAEKWRGWCTTALFPAVHSARCASCTLRTRATQPGIEGSRLDSCARLPRAVLMVIGVDVALITLLYCHSLLQRTAHTSQHNVEDQVSVLNECCGASSAGMWGHDRGLSIPHGPNTAGRPQHHAVEGVQICRS